MKFFKFILIYLLFFVSFISIRLSYLDKDTLASFALAINAVISPILALITYTTKEPDAQEDNNIESIESDD
jgi:hypothetical protein